MIWVSLLAIISAITFGSLKFLIDQKTSLNTEPYWIIMTTLFYRNFRLLILAILIIVAWGISSFFTLPRLEDPELVS
ncbi:MAG: hypothetical protein MGG11_05880, partial [Trichodesmium sp. MAG_R03]|nr:hypothetical protein [Trichodesmium sp. MAG_R03]